MSDRRAAAETRAVLLEAGFGEIHRVGFRGASLSRILAATGLTKGAFYHHFPSKMALGYAVVEELLTNVLHRRWLVPLAEEEDPIDCLGKIFAASRPESSAIANGCPLNNLAVEMAPIDEGFRIRIHRAYEQWRQAITTALARGQGRGLVTTDVDPASVASLIVATLSGCYNLGKSSLDPHTFQVCSAALATYLETLRSSPPDEGGIESPGPATAGLSD